ncbi:MULTISPECIES: sulfurtransferase [Corynebacterium]|uniref:sulfurtransferase n=1 Tax=Corynebacterium TaxID=1716 RepID=UPI000C085BC4|nr:MULTISPECIES: rhodanese-like domain-containing protein [Corynebacterium]MBF0581756.1 sulfurtransferase [Corynebacterium sp. ED61]
MSETTSHQESPFVTGEEMFSSFTAGQRMTVLDSHWAKTENSAWEAYVGQHIPGAMFCNPLTHLADIPSRKLGRNPLPNVEDLQRSFRDWGIFGDKPVYIYDAGPNIFAARAWWVFRWAGLQNVHILNGGTPAWESAGGDVAGGIGALRGRGTAEVKPGGMPELLIDDVENWMHDHLLIDAREESRHQGVREPFDHQAGHIPGSINIPVTRLQDSRGRVLSPEELRHILQIHGVTEGTNVAVYSGSGLHSSLFVAAMEHAGLYGAKNFIGGWSQWAADSSRAIERG